MAPEVLDVLDSRDVGSDYTNAVDIWAAGCVVYRIIAGRVPFPQIKSLVKYCENETLFPYDDPFGSSTQSEGSKFIRKLLVSNPNDRPSALQALKHDWIISGKTETIFVTEILAASYHNSSLLGGQKLQANKLAADYPSLPSSSKLLNIS